MNFRNFLLQTISLLYVLLFVYAATSKLLDFDTFRAQIGQSPLLSAYADSIAFAVPVLEIIIAFLLCSKVCHVAFFASFSLMAMFTAYIIIILNFSTFIPCSCGGILSDMTWTEHLFFNIVFLLLALLALLLEYNLIPSLRSGRANDNAPHLSKISFLIISSVLLVLSIFTVTGLYLLSEHEIHRNNSFVRQYPHHPVTTIRGHRLPYNSYYIAGISNNSIYLGNSTAPLHLLAIDTALSIVKPLRIQLSEGSELPFFSVQVSVRYQKFYLADGTIPIIYSGNTTDWIATPIYKGNTPFNTAEAMDSTFAIRSLEAVTENHMLGILGTMKSNHARFDASILRQYGNGAFETDGILTYNEQVEKLIYVFYYTNDYITTDKSLRAIKRGKTIDTFSRKAIKLAYLHGKTEKKPATQPAAIQQFSTSYGRYLFIKSDRLGRYEPEIMLGDASIIDVYDLVTETYKFSFYLYDYEREKVKKFIVSGGLLVGLTENYIVTYKLSKRHFDLTPLK